MSGGAFEFGKVFLQFLSKPLARQVLSYAQTHPALRRLCGEGGQTLNRLYVRMRTWSAAHGTGVKVTIKSLPEERAVALGAEMFSEAVLVAATAGVVGAELRHVAARRRRKKELRLAELGAREAALAREQAVAAAARLGLERELADLAARLECLEGRERRRGRLAQWVGL